MVPDLEATRIFPAILLLEILLKDKRYETPVGVGAGSDPLATRL